MLGMNLANTNVPKLVNTNVLKLANEYVFILVNVIVVKLAIIDNPLLIKVQRTENTIKSLLHFVKAYKWNISYKHYVIIDKVAFCMFNNFFQ
jgi:hypothetical protein